MNSIENLGNMVNYVSGGEGKGGKHFCSTELKIILEIPL
jgi:hypothetical protein